jgi:chromosome segregation ATPase
MNNEKNEENNFNESVLTNISDLTEEVKEKKLELESFKGQIKSLKQEYQKQLSVYFTLNKNVMQIESNIENILKEKSKIKKKILY